MSRPTYDRSRAPRVLVLGHDARMVLPIVRSLGRRGITMHVAWCPDDSPVLRSRFVSQNHRVPPYSPNCQGWSNSLRRVFDAHEFDLVIPATEDAAAALQFQRTEFADYSNLALLRESCFKAVFDKIRTGQLARDLGIPTPESQVVSSSSQLEKALTRRSGAAVVKPASSFQPQDLSRKRFVEYVPPNRSRSRPRALDYAALRSPVLVQDWVPGRGVGVGFLAGGGELLTAFQHVRLHETSGHGSTYRQSTPLDSSLLDATTRLVGAMNYTGVGMCEFRVDPSTGRWVFLEINGRFWGSLPLASAAGADFPWYLYRLLVHGDQEFPQCYRSGVRCRSLRSDIRWMWRALTQRTDGLGANGWRRSPITRWQWCKDLARLVTARDYLDTFVRDDAYPALFELGQLCGSMFRRVLPMARVRKRWPAIQTTRSWRR